MLPRTALTGNSLSLTVLKTIADAQPVLPDQAVAALKAIQPRRSVDPDYFFWSGQSNHITLGKKWAARIKRLNRYLALIDDHGKPMQFHSHTLRDTVAVELLLADVPIETVSKLLTHKSIRVTELHYAPWVKSRQRQLRDKAIDAPEKMSVSSVRSSIRTVWIRVPCWVLPQWRVSETIPSEVGLFDLVVIDEASQSDIWALPVLLRGKKLLIVGDRKQVSPSAIGMAEQRITDLISRFLQNQPFGSEMTPEKSASSEGWHDQWEQIPPG
jgi:hypothetical protein